MPTSGVIFFNPNKVEISTLKRNSVVNGSNISWYQFRRAEMDTQNLNFDPLYFLLQPLHQKK